MRNTQTWENSGSHQKSGSTPIRQPCLWNLFRLVISFWTRQDLLDWPVSGLHKKHNFISQQRIMLGITFQNKHFSKHRKSLKNYSTLCLHCLDLYTQYISHCWKIQRSKKVYYHYNTKWLRLRYEAVSSSPSPPSVTHRNHSINNRTIEQFTWKQISGQLYLSLNPCVQR